MQNTLFTELTTPIYNKSEKSDKSENVSKIKKNDFWDIVNNLGWKDRDELELTYEDFNKAYFSFQHESQIRICMKELENIFKNKYVSISSNEMKKFYIHIILRGYEFYAAVLKDPDFASYLISENVYQDINYKI